MLVKVTRPQLKKILTNNGRVVVGVGKYQNGVFWGGCYTAEVGSIEEAEQTMLYAKTHGWGKTLNFGVSKDLL